MFINERWGLWNCTEGTPYVRFVIPRYRAFEERFNNMSLGRFNEYASN